MSVPQAHTVNFNFQAPYHTIGSVEADQLWIVLHGYGQLAPYFIRKFGFLEDRARIIAPQALSLFYLEGTSGRVGASWMTRHERELAILNYLSYLTQAYLHALEQMEEPPKSVNVLGFSQGVSTLIRWLVASELSFDKLFMCAGSFPTDIDIAISRAYFQDKTCYYLYGNQDPYIQEGSTERLKEKFSAYGLQVTFHQFKGKHEVPQSLIKELI